MASSLSLGRTPAAAVPRSGPSGSGSSPCVPRRVIWPGPAPRDERPAREVSCRFYRQYTEYGMTRDISKAPENPLSVDVYPSPHEVDAALCGLVLDAAEESIARKNTFTLAIPGGSVLEALSGLVREPMGPAMRLDWRKVHIAYVNHRCVLDSHPKSSHAKALQAFVKDLPTKPHFLTVDGTLSPEEEAERYSKMILEMEKRAKMPRDPVTGLPQFDLVLLGMGADGHVGSLYPGQPATLATGDKLVVPQVKADGSASITMTAALMSSTAKAVICMTGSKKAAAVRMALEEQNLERGAAPAALVQPKALGAELSWLMDAAAASELSLFKSMRSLADR